MAIEFVGEDKPFEGPGKIKLKSGEEVVIPRMTLRKVLEVTQGVNKLIEVAKEKSPDLFNIFTATQSEDSNKIGAELLKTLPGLLPPIMSELVDLLATYLEKDRDWILDNMDTEDLVAVATPFFASIMQQGNHLLGPLKDMFNSTDNSKPAKKSIKSLPN